MLSRDSWIILFKATVHLPCKLGDGRWVPLGCGKVSCLHDIETLPLLFLNRKQTCTSIASRDISFLLIHTLQLNTFLKNCLQVKQIKQSVILSTDTRHSMQVTHPALITKSSNSRSNWEGLWWEMVTKANAEVHIQYKTHAHKFTEDNTNLLPMGVFHLVN